MVLKSQRQSRLFNGMLCCVLWMWEEDCGFDVSGFCYCRRSLPYSLGHTGVTAENQECAPNYKLPLSFDKYISCHIQSTILHHLPLTYLSNHFDVLVTNNIPDHMKWTFVSGED